MQGSEAKLARESVVPHLSRCEMARKLGLNHAYVRDMEDGLRIWAKDHLDRYMKVIADWKRQPTPRVRKPRTVKPKRRIKRAYATA